jgi:hypothetical protein
MQWQGKVYVDTALPFDLRSAPKLFNALADAIEWLAKIQGASYLWHYLDDYITIGRASTGECTLNYRVLHHVCSKLGVPLAADKCEGLTTCLTFLGIAIDTAAMELRLPQAKLARLKGEITAWLKKRSCTKCDLQSITGLLQHAATVVSPGRTFIQCLYNLLAITHAQHHHVRLNADTCSDLAWWSTFLEWCFNSGSSSYLGKAMGRQCRDAQMR